MPDPAIPTQSVVVQPAAPASPPLSLNIGALAEWAIAIVAIGALLALLHKLVTRDLGRDIGEVKHKLGNTTSRVDALEHLRGGDVTRIVRLEVAVENIDKGFDRIEKRLTTEFDQLAASIREVRAVAPRGAQS